MRWGWKAGILTAAAIFAFVPAAAAKTHAPSKRTVASRHANGLSHRTYLRSVGPGGHIAYGRRAHGVWRGHGTGYVDLAGDPESGYGFYPLPVRYRIGAWRYRMRHPRPPWENPVLFAIAADASRYYDWIPANQGYRYGVFDPNEGVGTPFFGGYYGPGGTDNEPPPFPGTRPYYH